MVLYGLQEGAAPSRYVTQSVNKCTLEIFFEDSVQ